MYTIEDIQLTLQFTSFESSSTVGSHLDGRDCYLPLRAKATNSPWSIMHPTVKTTPTAVCKLQHYLFTAIALAQLIRSLSFTSRITMTPIGFGHQGVIGVNPSRYVRG
jgi:hypothetical protein